MASLVRGIVFGWLLLLVAGTAAAQATAPAALPPAVPPPAPAPSVALADAPAPSVALAPARAASVAFVPAPPKEEPQFLDYRLSLAAADAVAFGLLISAVPLENGWLALGGLGVYLVGGPAIHASNGQLGRGGASFGLRLLAPFGGMIVGGSIGGSVTCDGGGGGSSSSDDGSDSGYGCIGGVLGGALIGGFAGMVGAAVIDDVFLGKVELPRRPPDSTLSVVRRTATLVPYVDPKRETFGLTLAGAF